MCDKFDKVWPLIKWHWHYTYFEHTADKQSLISFMVLQAFSHFVILVWMIQNSVYFGYWTIWPYVMISHRTTSSIAFWVILEYMCNNQRYCTIIQPELQLCNQLLNTKGKIQLCQFILTNFSSSNNSCLFQICNWKRRRKRRQCYAQNYHWLLSCAWKQNIILLLLIIITVPVPPFKNSGQFRTLGG